MVAVRHAPTAWTMQGRCPGCARSVSVVLALSGGRLPAEGAVRLQAKCAECGHAWTLPAVETAGAVAPARHPTEEPKE